MDTIEERDGVPEDWGEFFIVVHYDLLESFCAPYCF